MGGFLKDCSSQYPGFFYFGDYASTVYVGGTKFIPNTYVARDKRDDFVGDNKAKYTVLIPEEFL